MPTELPAVEGLTPVILWYTLMGLVGIGAIVVLVDKVADVFRKAKDRKHAHENYVSKQDFDAQQAEIESIRKGNRVMCRGILALLSHEINGNSDDKLKASQQEITDFLLDIH